MRVAVLRCRKLPSFVTWEIPNVEELFTDDRLVIEAFRERGVDAASLPWGDPEPDWNRFDLALLRSTWDYIDDPGAFLATMARIDRSACALFNPLDAIRWNLDKSYLLDLQDRGVPIVPTRLLSASDPAAVQETALEQGWKQVVLKPRVGAGAAGVRLLSSDAIAAALAPRAAHDPPQELLVQRLVESVRTEGEWSFIYVERELCHVLRKRPAPGDYRAHGIYGGTVERAHQPADEDVAQAEAILASLPFDLLYARLDLVRVDGRLAVMEVELVEPILYFHLAPEGVGRLADAAIARIG